VTSALDQWRSALEARAIPEAIIAAAPENPWGFPAEAFRRRAAVATTIALTPTTTRAFEVLPTQGTVLDVGVGAGATSLPLARRASLITGVDEQQDMLEAFEAEGRSANVATSIVLGRWPDVEAEAPLTDVVVSGHTIYNVQDLAPFVRAVDAHAGRRVVFELMGRHPLGWMEDLWMRFHGIRIADAPDADLAERAVRDCGFAPRRQERVATEDPSGGGFRNRAAALAFTRRRLCLTPDRDEELADALGDRLQGRKGLWSAGPPARTFVTLWWDVSRQARRA
jgi:SAM-dependent methyltransferase